MPKMLMLIGMPACGKSTFVNRMKKFARQTYSDMPSVHSSDDILESIASAVGKTYSQIFLEYIQAAEEAFTWRLNHSMWRGKDVIVDRTNLDRKARKRYVDKALKYGYIVQGIVFMPHSNSIEQSEWERRNMHRAVNEGKNIPVEILTDMRKRFTIPTLDEGIEIIEVVNSFE